MGKIFRIAIDPFAASSDLVCREGHIVQWTLIAPPSSASGLCGAAW